MVTDLASWHEPITDLFPRVHASADIERFRLDASQVEFFHENGYVAGIRVLDERQVEALRNDLAQFFDPQHPGHELWYEYHTNESGDPENVLFHALGAWRISPAFHDALWNPAFTVPASQLLGGPVRFWHDQLFCKPAHHGGVVAWHQDYSYWTRTRPLAHLTCWVALDRSTKENGCVWYVPGSHRWPLLPRGPLANDMHAARELLDEDQQAQFDRAVAIELEPGEASFHHAMLMHGSYENRTSQPRRAMVLNVVRDGVVSDSDEPLLEGVPPIARGEPLGGTFFPLLFHPQNVPIG